MSYLRVMEVRAKKSLGQHFLTDQDIARRIVDALQGSPVLEVGPGMGVLTKYLIPQLAGQALEPGRVHSRFAAAEYGLSSTPAPATEVTEQSPTVSPRLKAIEIDKESVAYLKKHFPELGDGLIEGDFLKMDLQGLFPGQFSIIGNFPYNISSQIFFKIIDNRDLVPEVVCMIQKEVAERIAEKPGTKTYGILSVFLQAWYDIEYLFTVGSGAFNPPPKVQSAVIRLTRNSRTELGCDEKLFKTIVKTAFGQRRKTLRNSLKPIYADRSLSDNPDRSLSGAEGPVFDLRPERLSVEDFIDLTLRLTP